LEQVEFKRVLPKDYRLFQPADLSCTLKLAELKMIDHVLSSSESTLFESEKVLKKQYLKILLAREI